MVLSSLFPPKTAAKADKPDAAPHEAQLALQWPDVRPAAGEESRRIALGDRIVPYLLRRARRRTIGLSIDHRGLRVGAPARTTLTEIESLIHKHSDWVVDKLDEWRTRHRPGPIQISEGTRLPFLGRELEVRLAIGTNRAIWGLSTLTLCLKPGTEPGPLLEKALRERAREHFANRLPIFAAQLDVAVPPLALSSARTRWGSCSFKTGIRLNWRLIHFSPEIVDYVIVHELAHLRHMNHGPQFWSVVESSCPDYRTQVRELKRVADQLPHW